MNMPQREVLPQNFCDPRLIFSAIVLAQLTAFLILLAPLGKPAYLWEDLAIISLFTQWVTILSLAVLCVVQKWLQQLGVYWAAAISYLILLIMTGLVSHGAWYFGVLPIKPEQPLFDVHYFIFLLRNLGIGALVGAVSLRYFYVQCRWRITERALTEARLQALQSRIRPHFLFNSLNTIASLTRLDPVRAEQAVENLADLFRASLAEAQQRVTVAEEINLCRDYLQIETLRLGNRLQVEWLLETVPLDALLPPLSVQPLLENAVCYGIQPLPEGGIIRVTGLSDQQFLKIEVESPLAQQPTSSSRGLHIAQDNLRQRLQTLYGYKARLDIKVDQNCYRVSLRLPYEKA